MFTIKFEFDDCYWSANRGISQYINLPQFDPQSHCKGHSSGLAVLEGHYNLSNRPREYIAKRKWVFSENPLKTMSLNRNCYNKLVILYFHTFKSPWWEHMEKVSKQWVCKEIIMINLPSGGHFVLKYYIFMLPLWKHVDIITFGQQFLYSFLCEDLG